MSVILIPMAWFWLYRTIQAARQARDANRMRQMEARWLAMQGGE